MKHRAIHRLAGVMTAAHHSEVGSRAANNARQKADRQTETPSSPPLHRYVAVSQQQHTMYPPSNRFPPDP